MENKITIEQAKQQITEGFSSVLTREDVLHLLDCLVDSKNGLEISNEMIEELSDEITESLSSEGIDIIDDYTLDMSYKEVELDSIDLNKQIIKNAVVAALETYIDNNN